MRYAVDLAEPDADQEPASLAEAKAQCRLDPGFAADDALLEGLVAAARDLAERHTGRLLTVRTGFVALDGFPRGGPVVLPVEPVNEVTAVEYTAADGTSAAMDLVDLEQSGLAFSPPTLAVGDVGWPDALPGKPVTVRLTCGRAAPRAAKRAVLLAVGYWHAHRGDGGDPEKDGLPPAAIRLLNLCDTGGYA